MKNNKVIILFLYLLICFPVPSLQANNTFLWLYDSCYNSCKEYVNECITSEHFWKNTTLFLVGLITVKECAPVIKNTWQSIWRMPKKETETEKLNTLFNSLNNRIIILEQPPQQKNTLDKEEIKNLFEEWIKSTIAQINHNQRTLNNTLVNTIKRLDNEVYPILDRQQVITVPSSSSEEDEDWHTIQLRPRKATPTSSLPCIPPLKLPGFQLQEDYSGGKKTFTPTNSSEDASAEESSSEDDEESITITTPSSLGNSSRSSSSPHSLESSVRLNSNSDSSEEDEEIYEDDLEGHPTVVGYKRSPRKKLAVPKTHSLPSTPHHKTGKKRAGSPLKNVLLRAHSYGDVLEEKTLDANEESLSSGFWGPNSPDLSGEKELASEQSILMNATELLARSQTLVAVDQDGQDNDDSPTFFVAEDGSTINVDQEQPTTPITAEAQQFRLLESLEAQNKNALKQEEQSEDGSEVVVSPRKAEKIAKKHYYSEHPNNPYKPSVDTKCITN